MHSTRIDGPLFQAAAFISQHINMTAWLAFGSAFIFSLGLRLSRRSRVDQAGVFDEVRGMLIDSLRFRRLRLEHSRIPTLIEAAESREILKRVENPAAVFSLEEEMPTAFGINSGGYIIIDMPDEDRPMFHDLLMGFEEYGKLNGYSIAFSIDATLSGKIAFKFTAHGKGAAIGSDQIRIDFKKYIDRIWNENGDDLDEIPVITSIKEHVLLVSMLRSRIKFFKDNYSVAQDVVKSYQKMLDKLHVLPAPMLPNILVQTGGSVDSRRYNVANSRNILQGDSSSLIDNSLQGSQSFVQIQEKINALDDAITKLRASDQKSDFSEQAAYSFMKIRDELAEEAEPNLDKMWKWLEAAKKSLGVITLGYDAAEAIKRVWELFGI